MSNAVQKAPEPSAVVALDETATILDVIRRAASDPSVDVEKMERLMAMQERLVARQAEGAFNSAMMNAQHEMTTIQEDADNSQTHSKYASYVALDKVARPIYVKHGFSLSFGQGDGAPENYVRVIADVSHIDGHRREYHADMPADGKGAKGGDVMTKTHATGSAFSYGRRYLLALIFNLVVGNMQDDDGNAASKPTITADQKAELLKIMTGLAKDDTPEQLKKRTERFLSYYQIKAIDLLPAAAFKDARDGLLRKREKAA